MSGAVKNEDIPRVRDRLVRAFEEVRGKKSTTPHSLTSTNTIETFDWPKLRPNLSLDFPNQATNCHIDPGPVVAQETALLEEVLSCYLGTPGQLITPDPLTDPWAVRTFTVNSEIDSRLADLARKSLDMASDFSMVMRFLQAYRKLSVGRVNHALAAALDKFMVSYTQFIRQLENRCRNSQLNLHSLWFSIQSVHQPIQTIAKIVRHIGISRLRGADTLNYLIEFTSTLMDFKDKQVCLFLIESAAYPIMVSVQKWIFNGVIYDPFDEFMIVGNPRVHLKKEKFPDEYWSKRYQIRKDCTPYFLKRIETTILNAGKYLNVIKDCLDAGWNVKLAVEEDLVYSYENPAYLDVIGRAYSHSSKYLLSLMLDEHSIIDRIKSVKRYLLLQQGDFVVQILDNCESQLRQPVANCMPDRIQALVEMAIRLPSTSDDKFRDDIVMNFKTSNLSQQVLKILSPSGSEHDESDRSVSENVLTGLQAFTLSVKCIWPVSLVFNFPVIASYEMIFRQLFYCKYVERLLCKIWLMDKPLKIIQYKSSKCFTQCFSLRHKMMHFIQSIEYYLMEEAIEPNWVEFLQAVATVESIDSLLEVHWQFLSKCMNDCLLRSPDLHVQFQSLLSTCEEFCNLIISLGCYLDLESDDSYMESIEKLDFQFQAQLSTFFDMIRDASSSDLNTKLWNIILRENYNNYFDGMLDNMSKANGDSGIVS